MKRAAPALLFFALSLLMNLPWLSMTPLSGTEGHRALTADEMVRSSLRLKRLPAARACSSGGCHPRSTARCSALRHIISPAAGLDVRPVSSPAASRWE
jgi:hypothetical protein